jgi:hypothetical protein
MSDADLGEGTGVVVFLRPDEAKTAASCASISGGWIEACCPPWQTRTGRFSIFFSI